MFFILSILNLALLLCMLKIDHDRHRDIFSAGAVFIYFSFLPAFSNLYFSLNEDAFADVVLINVAPIYRNSFYVDLALFFYIVGNIVTYVGIRVGLKDNGGIIHGLLSWIFMHGYYETLRCISPQGYFRSIRFIGVVILFVGVVAYVQFLGMLGGLEQIWSELELRSEKNAGLGYIQSLYTICVSIGGLALAVTKSMKNRYVTYLAIVAVVLMLGSFGSRGPVVNFVLSLLVVRHLVIKKYGISVFFKLAILGPILVAFVLVFLELRENQDARQSNDLGILVSDSISNLETGFIARIGRLERDIVILNYFDTHDYWQGRSYLGLLYAPIPRSLMENKPPNDTGMYLRYMALGYDVTPPVPVRDLAGSGWPEGNWAGYMNFGVTGFVVWFFVSGYMMGSFFCFLYRYRYPVLPCISYSMLVIGGAPVLSVLGLVYYATNFMYICLLNRLVARPIIFFFHRAANKYVGNCSLGTKSKVVC